MMKTIRCILKVICLAMLLLSGDLSAAESSAKPNIVLIVADDLGYADVGVQGAKDIPTPNLDALANSGVRCTDGYVTGPVCSPSRAGILTGRYQERFGHDVLFWNSNANAGLSPKETTFVQHLRDAGYVTGMVGKWHLGKEEYLHPMSRGFMEFFGDPGHGSSYLPEKDTGVVGRTEKRTIYEFHRNREPVDIREYLTDAYGNEAANFISKHAKAPFFLYVAFNAPHVPLQATDKYLARVSGITDAGRRTYAAMVSALDDAVGRILDSLTENKIADNTIVVFLSDNGGDSRQSHDNASNYPLSFGKGSTYEGGIRVPFFLKWPEKYPVGVYRQPIISLDLAPTFLAAADVRVEPEWKLDGVDLTPFLSGENKEPPHDILFWRYWFTGEKESFAAAVRQGPWKLVRAGLSAQSNWKLYNLDDDIGEKNDLAKSNPERVARMVERWEEWNKSLRYPLWHFAGPQDKTPFVWPEDQLQKH